LRANSNYASNAYFLPVMGLIFLRHAYSRFLFVEDAIEPTLPKRGGKTRALVFRSLPSLRWPWSAMASDSVKSWGRSRFVWAAPGFVRLLRRRR